MELSKRTFTILITATLLLLFYVHEQVTIFQVSYSIERKEREIARLSEDYKTAKFYLTRLRSPHVLSQRIKELSLNLAVPKDRQVIRVLKPKAVPVQIQVEESWPPAPFRFLSLLHFVKEAQAKTSKG